VSENAQSEKDFLIESLLGATITGEWSLTGKALTVVWSGHEAIEQVQVFEIAFVDNNNTMITNGEGNENTYTRVL